MTGLLLAISFVVWMVPSAVSFIKQLFSKDTAVSHFSDIGYHFNNQADFLAFVEKQLPNMQEHSFEGGTYRVLKDGSGTELWFQAAQDGSIAGVTPYFCGKSMRKIGITKALENKENPLEDVFYCWSNPTAEPEADDDDDDDCVGDFPFIVAVPDYRLLKKDAANSVQDMNVVIFAEEVLTYKDEKEFAQKQDMELKLASESFFPKSAPFLVILPVMKAERRKTCSSEKSSHSRKNGTAFQAIIFIGSCARPSAEKSMSSPVQG